MGTPFGTTSTNRGRKTSSCGPPTNPIAPRKPVDETEPISRRRRPRRAFDATPLPRLSLALAIPSASERKRASNGSIVRDSRRIAARVRSDPAFVPAAGGSARSSGFASQGGRGLWVPIACRSVVRSLLLPSPSHSRLVELVPGPAEVGVDRALEVPAVRLAPACELLREVVRQQAHQSRRPGQREEDSRGEGDPQRPPEPEEQHVDVGAGRQPGLVPAREELVNVRADLGDPVVLQQQGNVRAQQDQVGPDRVELRDVVLQVRQELVGEGVLLLLAAAAASAAASFAGGSVRVDVRVQEEGVDVLQQQSRVGRQGVDVLQYPGKVRFDVVEALQDLVEVRLDAGQVLPVVEDALDDGTNVRLEAVQPGQYRRGVRDQRRRPRIRDELPDLGGFRGQPGDDPQPGEELVEEVGPDPALVLLVVRSDPLPDAVDLPEGDVRGGQEGPRQARRQVGHQRGGGSERGGDPAEDDVPAVPDAVRHRRLLSVVAAALDLSLEVDQLVLLLDDGLPDLRGPGDEDVPLAGGLLDVRGGRGSHEGRRGSDRIGARGPRR
mmetsp:Transcript_27850/g.65455  ORF Transcript_27850/g.65455 Transcript_27850/m.65455 type:complete len:552 (+) Transcript_27850:49-1704(+)